MTPPWRPPEGHGTFALDSGWVPSHSSVPSLLSGLLDSHLGANDGLFFPLSPGEVQLADACVYPNVFLHMVLLGGLGRRGQ